MPTKIPIFDFLRFIYVNIHTFYSAQLRIQIKNLNRDKIINGDSNYILNKEKNHSNCLFSINTFLANMNVQLATKESLILSHIL